MGHAFEELRLDHITKMYGAVGALVDLCVSFKAGTVTAIQGANGSGKSTLLKIASLELRPTKGEVRGLPTSRVSRVEQKSWIGTLGHQPALYPDLSAKENLELSARLHGLKDSELLIREALQAMSAETFQDRAVKTLSRGQAQRICFALATLHRPRLLVLDEPDAGLDESAKHVVTESILAQRERGVCVILATHDSGFAERVADYRVHLEAGALKKGES